MLSEAKSLRRLLAIFAHTTYLLRYMYTRTYIPTYLLRMYVPMYEYYFVHTYSTG